MEKSLINKYFTGILIISAVLFLSACKKEKLSPEPQTAFSEAQAFANPQRIQQQVFGVYSAMKNGNFLGGRGLVYNDVRGEDWLNITGNGVTGLAAWNFSIVSSDNQTEGFWTNGYATINRANVVLQGLDENEAKVGTAVANNYRGELRFLRAVVTSIL
jgi:hypothetical protein